MQIMVITFVRKQVKIKRERTAFPPPVRLGSVDFKVAKVFFRIGDILTYAMKIIAGTP